MRFGSAGRGRGLRAEKGSRWIRVTLRCVTAYRYAVWACANSWTASRVIVAAGAACERGPEGVAVMCWGAAARGTKERPLSDAHRCKLVDHEDTVLARVG